MNLSPTVRTILTFVAAALGALVPVGVALGIPVVVLSVMGALVVGLAAIGIIPPQTGGTQVGVVSPAIAVPPGIETAVDYDVVEAGEELRRVDLAAPPRHSIADGPAVRPGPQSNDHSPLF